MHCAFFGRKKLISGQGSFVARWKVQRVLDTWQYLGCFHNPKNMLGAMNVDRRNVAACQVSKWLASVPSTNNILRLDQMDKGFIDALSFTYYERMTMYSSPCKSFCHIPLYPCSPVFLIVPPNYLEKVGELMQQYPKRKIEPVPPFVYYQWLRAPESGREQLQSLPVVPLRK